MKEFSSLYDMVDGDAVKYISTAFRPPAAVRYSNLKCVAVHANSFGIGGLEKVVHAQCVMFRKMGMDVHLILSVPPGEDSLPLPQGVVVHTLPPLDGDYRLYMLRRATAIERIVVDNGVQLFIDSAYQNLFCARSIVMWDWVVVKRCSGVPVLLHWHNVFSRFLRMPRGDVFASAVGELSRLCDGIISLSRVDSRFFSALGFRSWFLPNPIDDSLISACERRGNRNGRTVLWCGRVTDLKRPMYALEVFKMAHAMNPGMRLVIVGGGGAGIMSSIEDFVRRNGLEQFVVIAGEQADPYPFYKEADVFLSTSQCEGYPVTFIEAIAFGLPIVCVGKAYLELVRSNKGAVVVEDGDRSAAATELVRLTTPGKDRDAAHHGVDEMWSILKDYDLSRDYERIFAEVGHGCSLVKEEPGRELNLLVDEMVRAFADGTHGRADLVRSVFADARMYKWIPLVRRIEKILAMFSLGETKRRHLLSASKCKDILGFLNGKSDVIQ